MRASRSSVLVAAALLGTAAARARPAAEKDPVPLDHELPIAFPASTALLDLGGLTDIPTALRCLERVAGDERMHDPIRLQTSQVPLGRRLTLHALSRWGCPGTTTVAGGASYAIELSPRLRAVFSGGVAGLPDASERGWIVRTGLRGDLQWTTAAGEQRSLGVEAVELLKSAVREGSRRRIGASFGGTF